MEKTDFGLIGLGVMGQNLVLNIERNGFTVSVYNRTLSKTENFIKTRAVGKNIKGFVNIKEFVESIKTPKKIMLMVKAGKAVDAMIENLLPYLDKGDIIIDGGNSFFQDTIQRYNYLKEKGIRYIGTGVSGGEEGALNGPSIMPGGDKSAYSEIEPIFISIAAKVNGEPCCVYIGPDGAGHYVKMIHNGIEYADMQLISESYFLIKKLTGMSNEEMSEVFAEWNKKELSSYLIEITSYILKKKDAESGKYIIDLILDKAAQKGTGKWASQNALELGVPAPTITESVFARCISALKEERIEASKILKGPEIKFSGNKNQLIDSLQKALYAAKVCSYAQGFALMREASKEYNWNLNYGKIAMIWRGGCIIRAQFLEHIKEAFDKNPGLKNLLLDDYFKSAVEKAQQSWREIVNTAIENGIPIPAFSSALAYYDNYRTERLPANMIQAQRDYFGAHTYQRIDKEGIFHTKW